MTLQRSGAAHRTPPGSFALCESGATATNVFCAKAKRQQQSALPERKSTIRYGDNPINENKDQLSSRESATGYFI
ncbi:hypothetical protein C7Y47_09925 [Lysinibacillus sphaericus]|uniref:Uncharacterized protein n=1 Tax=Lysinibacillus sphaericus TaxID=1421 RepID=A0A544ULB4_LYSSH|nr:hypothetical protein C7Y47_09925 [Lysinibacillus sp. SDF0037]